MKIQFTKDDPRAGMVVEINDTQARQHIEDGAAVEHKAEKPTENKAVNSAPENKSKKDK